MLSMWQGGRSAAQCRRLAAKLCVPFWSSTPPDATSTSARIPCPATHLETRSAQGRTWTDEYSYLESGGLPLAQHLQAENAYFTARMQGTLSLQRQLQMEMLDRHADAVITVPEKLGSYEYYTVATHERPSVCYMRRCTETGHEQRVLDLNEQQYASASLGQMKLSKSQQYAAYTIDDGEGSETFKAVVKHVALGQEVDEIPHAVSVEFWSDDELLYTLPDADGRPHKVMLHRVAKSGPDTCLLEERDPQWFLDVGRSKDWQYLTLTSTSKTASEVHLLGAHQPWDGELLCMETRQAGLEYFVEHHSGQLFILAAAGSQEYALYTADAQQPRRRHWEAVLPHRPGVIIEDMDIFCAAIVLYERHAGTPRVSILPFSHGRPCVEQLHTVHLPAAAATELTPGANPDFHATFLTIKTSSPIGPETAWRIDLHPPHAVAPAPQPLGAQQDSNHNHNSAELVCMQTRAVAADGASIPITLAHRQGTPLDGSRPLLLTAYGAYGMCADAGFRPERLSLMERGWVVAIAHVRGGGELGRGWYRAAVGANKQQSVRDLEACLDHLIAQGYSSEGRVALEASSAGALTAAALLNARLASFGAALLRVPFVDLLSAMTRPELPLTVHERDEWGDPLADADVLHAMLALCPYQNVAAAAYPPVLVTCVGNDQRVPAWGPAKFTARLRARGAGSAPVFLAHEERGGHFGSDADSVRDAARDYAFLLHAMSGGWKE